METRARDIMTTKLLKASEGITLEEGIRLLINNGITGVPVVDQSDKMVGVLSEYDIIQTISKMKAGKPTDFKRPIEFSKKVESIPESEELDKVISRFVDSRFRRLFVTDKKGKLVGIITRRDIMRLFYYRARLGEE